MRKRTCKTSKNQVENSEVHLLPAFALPPRGDGNETKQKGREKTREINAHRHRHLEEMTEEQGK